MSLNWIVVTTINEPTIAISKISQLCKEESWCAVVVGDKKTPKNWTSEGIHYLDIERQNELFPDLSELLPFNHYARKNLGYLYAIKNGAKVILETDDDNIPYNKFGLNISRHVDGHFVAAGSNSEWVNIYKYFTNRFTWPRGLPLDKVHNVFDKDKNTKQHECLVQQYLADSDPDVDAIHRLLFTAPLNFEIEAPIVLGERVWSPFNSQNTIFFEKAFILMYLPSFVSFRMTDIWRSFVVQSAIWLMNSNISFHSSTVKQERNIHNLLKDFEGEIPGYLNNQNIKNILDQEISLLLESNCKDLNIILRRLWLSLNEKGIIEDREIDLLDQWLKHF